MVDDDINKSVTTARGTGRALSPAIVNGPYSAEAPGTGSDWFSPLAPMPPIAPPEVAGRAWDFAPGYNLSTNPRAFEEVPFQALRALSMAYDPVRIIIERRKDQLTRVPWTIRYKHVDPTAKPPKVSALPAKTRERIADVTRLFKRPSYGETFNSFLRAILEDLLVIDAPSVYLKRNRSGDVIGLQWLDGALVKRVISDWGTIPEPREWSGETFEWNSQTITRENFAQMGWSYLHGWLWPPIAQYILKGLPAIDYCALDLIYKPLSVRPGHFYGLSPVETVMATISTGMRRAYSQLAYFTEGNQPDAIFALPETWTPDQVQRFQDYWDALYSGNLANRRKLKFVVGKGDSYQALKEPPLKTEMDEWLIRIVCAAFSYPPSAFVSLSNRSIAEQHERTNEEEGLGILKNWAAELFNDIIELHLGHDDLEFAWLEEEVVDQEKQATVLTKYVEAGVLSISEVREKLGEEPSPDPNASKLMVRTTAGYVPIGEVDPDEDGSKQ